MNNLDSINTYGIKEVHANALTKQKVQAEEVFVYTSEEMPLQENMFRPSRSEHFAIHLNISETIEIKYNLINYVLPANSLFIIHPGAVHALKEANKLPSIIIGFTHEFLGSAMMHKKHSDALGFLFSGSNPLFLLTEEEAQTFSQQMLYLKTVINNINHPFREEMIHHGFTIFMLELAAISKKYRVSDEHPLTRKDDILYHFLKQLAAHFKEERSVQFYADALFITPKHLTKTVKELTTKTCGELIDEMVITEAKILLSDLFYSVAQVADKLHFSDQFFFSKFFKRRTGMSPKEYKTSL